MTVAISARAGRLWGVVLLVAAVVISACGGAGGKTAASAAPSTAASTSSAAAPAAAGKTYTIKYAVLLTPNDPIGKAALEFKDLVEKASNKRITVDVFLNGALGDGPSEVSQAQSGALQIVQASPAFVTKWVPTIGAVNIWFTVKNDADAIAAVNSTAFQAQNELIRTKAGLRALAWEDFGMYTIISRKPIKTLADVKGLKIRSTPDKYVQMTLESLGAVPTVVPFTEVITDLQTGVLDADIDPITTDLKTSEYQAAKYVTVMNGGWAPALILMNDAFFRSLPADLQKVVLDAAKQATDHEIANYAAGEAATVKDLQGKGAVIYTLPDSERALWVERMKPVYDAFQKDTGTSVSTIVPSSSH